MLKAALVSRRDFFQKHYQPMSSVPCQGELLPPSADFSRTRHAVLNHPLIFSVLKKGCKGAKIFKVLPEPPVFHCRVRYKTVMSDINCKYEPILRPLMLRTVTGVFKLIELLY